MSKLEKYGQDEKKTLHCLVNARAYDHLKRHVLDEGVSIASFINAYITSIYEASKKGKNVRKNTNMD